MALDIPLAAVHHNRKMISHDHAGSKNFVLGNEALADPERIKQCFFHSASFLGFQAVIFLTMFDVMVVKP